MTELLIPSVQEKLFSNLTANSRCCHCAWEQGRCLFCRLAVHFSFEDALLNEPLSCSLIIIAVFIFGCLGNGHILIVRELQMSGIPKKTLAKYCSVSSSIQRGHCGLRVNQVYGNNKHIKMCVCVLPICWPATSLGFINMTLRLSVFHKSSSWKGSFVVLHLLFSVYLVVMLKQMLPCSAQWSIKNWTYPQVQRFTLQKCSFNPQITTPKLKSLLPQTPSGLILGNLAQGC